MKKILVCGGRDYNNKEKVFEELNKIEKEKQWKNIIIINGSAKGADFLSTLWAMYYKKRLKEFPANWELYGKKAGILRNIEMLSEKPDLVVAFTGGKGTAHMVGIAKKAGIEVIEINE